MIAALVSAPWFSAGEISAAEPSKVDFARDIQPIFTKRCFECHGDLEAYGDGCKRYRQRCRCDRAALDAPEERWEAWEGGPRYDFNTYVELCRCCGIERPSLRVDSAGAVFLASQPLDNA